MTEVAVRLGQQGHIDVYSQDGQVLATASPYRLGYLFTDVWRDLLPVEVSDPWRAIGELVGSYNHSVSRLTLSNYI